MSGAVFRSNSATVTAPEWRPWTAYEAKLLARMKEDGVDRETLQRTFPGRTWDAIKRKRTSVGPRMRSGRPERQTYSRACPVVRSLTAVRREKGVSRKELAALLGVYPGTVQGWESGKMVPPWRKLAKWCDTLGVVLVVRTK